MTKCPICDNGKLKSGEIEETMFGIYLGKFPAEICDRCGESFTSEEMTKKIEMIAKEKGIWGLGIKTKVAKTGNSLAIRIPKNIAKFLHLKEGRDVFIHPEKDKFVIETI
ncbi:AbrB/MazE/SpoVT family DNA-binding domain-containing protein [Candidatus Woesearchaeota archaeon]|nr:AbrB/MazE/SpoVT family DNA-binding domain-containing protein [Candidatus Woesearchaeota archaeon]